MRAFLARRALAGDIGEVTGTGPVSAAGAPPDAPARDTPLTADASQHDTGLPFGDAGPPGGPPGRVQPTCDSRSGVALVPVRAISVDRAEPTDGVTVDESGACRP